MAFMDVWGFKKEGGVWLTAREHGGDVAACSGGAVVTSACPGRRGNSFDPLNATKIVLSSRYTKRVARRVLNRFHTRGELYPKDGFGKNAIERDLSRRDSNGFALSGKTWLTTDCKITSIKQIEQTMRVGHTYANGNSFCPSKTPWLRCVLNAAVKIRGQGFVNSSRTEHDE